MNDEDICETCGEPGTRCWVTHRVLCDECRDAEDTAMIPDDVKAMVQA